jgi:hypothetical protein
MRRTKATLIRRTGELASGPAVTRPHAIESTVRYLGVEVGDAREIAEKIDVGSAGQKCRALPVPLSGGFGRFPDSP